MCVGGGGRDCIFLIFSRGGCVSCLRACLGASVDSCAEIKSAPAVA